VLLISCLLATMFLLSVSSAHKKETSEKVKSKFVNPKDMINGKVVLAEFAEDLQPMGETENSSPTEQKESQIKDRIKRHLFKDRFKQRPQPIIIINRYGDEDPGNAWGAPAPTKGWAAPPPPTKGWTTPPPTTRGWTTRPPPPPPPPTQGWPRPPPPPPPPHNTGWSNINYEEDEVSGGNSWNIAERIIDAGARLLPTGSGSIRF